MGYQLGGKTVLVTGAAMGMGKLYALKAVQENAKRLILWDINEEKLKETARELEGRGSEIYIDVVDLSQLQEIQKAAQRTKQFLHGQSLDVLINNAGVISSKQYFWHLDDIKDVYFTMSVNSLAPMYVTHAFIKEMIEDSRTPKRILNIASAAALVCNPNMSAYVTSKCACLGWSDTLRLELKKAKKIIYGSVLFVLLISIPACLKAPKQCY